MLDFGRFFQSALMHKDTGNGVQTPTVRSVHTRDTSSDGLYGHNDHGLVCIQLSLCPQTPSLKSIQARPNISRDKIRGNPPPSLQAVNDNSPLSKMQPHTTSFPGSRH